MGALANDLTQAFPVATPVRFAAYPWIATVTPRQTDSLEGVSTGNARSLTEVLVYPAVTQPSVAHTFSSLSKYLQAGSALRSGSYVQSTIGTGTRV